MCAKTRLNIPTRSDVSPCIRKFTSRKENRFGGDAGRWDLKRHGAVHRLDARQCWAFNLGRSGIFSSTEIDHCLFVKTAKLIFEVASNADWIMFLLSSTNASCCFPYSFKHEANGNLWLGVRCSLDHWTGVAGLALGQCGAWDGFFWCTCHAGAALPHSSFEAGSFTYLAWVMLPIWYIYIYKNIIHLKFLVTKTTQTSQPIATHFSHWISLCAAAPWLLCILFPVLTASPLHNIDFE